MIMPFDTGHDHDHDGENGTVGEGKRTPGGGSVSCFLTVNVSSAHHSLTRSLTHSLHGPSTLKHLVIYWDGSQPAKGNFYFI